NVGFSMREHIAEESGFKTVLDIPRVVELVQGTTVENLNNLTKLHRLLPLLLSGNGKRAKP
ncbi:MAG: hypothetical protein L0Y55_14755, partial [Anaerolineales bacterium]|nr:hypothetical protein [Anaerolineales bacterium]